MKVAVIGGGPAGMMAAIESSKGQNEVILLEKNNKLGKKLLITGKGRCNITSSIDIKDFISNIPGNGKFLYSAFQNYTNKDIINFLKQKGIGVKEERGNRIFPTSDKSIDVLNAFEKELKDRQIKIKFGARVIKINTKKDETENDIKKIEKVKSVTYLDKESKEKTIEIDKVILATGGLSYSSTGSTGDGYKIAQELGHNITKIQPSLIPLIVEENNLCKALQGLSLKNVLIKLIDKNENKLIYEDFGEMLFTHFGVSGPIILSSSAHLLRYKNVEKLLKCGKIKLIIDLKPGLTKEKLDLRLQRDFLENKNKEYKNSLNNLLPQKIIEPIIKLSQVNPEKKVNTITKEERSKIGQLLKNFELTITGFRPIEEAIITSGGIDTKQVNPKTMESKIVSGLYFAGEIIDVDAYTGGFNLQIAYSTGVTAGKLN